MSDAPVEPPRRLEAVDEIDAMLAASSLPSLPEIAMRLLELCGSRAAGAREIAGVVETDPALAAKLIRLANAVQYGAGIPVTNIQAAAVRLGTDRIKSVALAFELSGVAGEAAGDHFDFGTHWRDSVARGCIARAVAMHQHRNLAGEAFLVGLLQDLCIPVLAEHAPGPYAGLLRHSGGCQLRLATLEAQAFGLNHIHVVTRLFQRWGMPALLSDAIGRHHTRPPVHPTADPAMRLWQIAYFVGALPIGVNRRPTYYDASLAEMMRATFDIADALAADLLRLAEQEFCEIQDMFRPFIGRTVSAADLLADAAGLLCVPGALSKWAAPAKRDADAARDSGREQPTVRLQRVAEAAMSEPIDAP